MNNQRSTYSWTVVVIMLILFWPVGLFLLFGKLANDRSASFGGGAGLIRFVGFILVAFGVIMLFTLFSGDGEIVAGGIMGAIIFGLPGLWLLKKGKKMRKTGDKNRTYINYIVNNKINDVSELARRMGVSQQQVIDDVNLMINNGMLGRARLNLSNGKIQFPRPKPRPQTQTKPRPRPEQRPRPTQGHTPRPEPRPVVTFEPKTIRCTACSANNFVESLPAQCEYCGTSLHEKK